MSNAKAVDPQTINVLLVDNDIGYAKVAQQHLTKFAGKKFSILWKQDAESGLEQLVKENTIEIILLESNLPGMSGLEFASALRSKNIDTPIILLTATKDFRLAIEAMKLGVEEYLIKEEVSETVLPRTILNVLDKVDLKKRIAEAERNRIFSERRTEAIRELIVAICHEFNNPLTAIKLTADAMGRQGLPEQQKKLVNEISDRIAAIENKIKKLQTLQNNG